MNPLRKTLLLASLAAAALMVPASSSAAEFDFGVRTPILPDASPGAVSVPFEIPIRQHGATREPFSVQIAIEGFDLDPNPVPGERIGSVDVLTASGTFGDKAIYSDGPGADGVRTWTLDWQLSEDKRPIVAEIRDGVALRPDGETLPDSNSTLIGFTVPVNYHGFPVSGLVFRFNENERGVPSPGVGAINPPEPGKYLIRSRVRPNGSDSAVVASAYARVGPADTKTSLRVRPQSKRVRPGQKVRFSLSTANGTSDSVTVWRGGRRIGWLAVGPNVTRFTWRAKARLRGRAVRFVFKPAHGPARKVTVRVARR